MQTSGTWDDAERGLRQIHAGGTAQAVELPDDIPDKAGVTSGYFPPELNSGGNRDIGTKCRNKYHGMQKNQKYANNLPFIHKINLFFSYCGCKLP